MTSISDLKLRPIQSDDFKIYYQLVSDPKVAQGAHFQPAQSVRQAKQLLNDDLTGAKVLAITLHGQMIGLISLYPMIGAHSAPNHKCLEIADMMLPKYQNHHYMTRGIGMLIQHLRAKLHVKRLVALVDETNVASRKVLENNHFRNYRSVLDFNSDHANLVYQLDLN